MKAIESRIPLGKHVVRILLMLGIGWFIVLAGTAIWVGAIQPLATIALPSFPKLDGVTLDPTVRKVISVFVGMLAIFLCIRWTFVRLLKIEKDYEQFKKRLTDESLLNRDVRKTVIELIASLRDYAITYLLERTISSDGELKVLIDDVQKWEGSVESLLAKGPGILAVSHFQGVEMQVDSHDGLNHEHRVIRGIIAQRADRLSELIAMLEQVENDEKFKKYNVATMQNNT